MFYHKLSLRSAYLQVSGRGTKKSDQAISTYTTTTPFLAYRSSSLLSLPDRFVYVAYRPGWVDTAAHVAKIDYWFI